MRELELIPYGECGYTLIPLGSRGKHLKIPLCRGWRKDTYPATQIRNYFQGGHNLGVRLEDTQLVVDVDPRNFDENGKDSLVELEKELGIDIQGTSPCVLTGGGGFHFYMKKPADVPVVDSLPTFPGVEFKTFGRQVVAAGSIHPSGGMYAWDVGPDLADAPAIPERLLTLIRRPPPREAEGCGSLTPEEVAACLEQLDVKEFGNHDKWLQLMMSCHHASGGEARYEFVDWSTSDPRYADQAWAVGRRWDSLSVKRSGSVVTAGTLFKHILAVGGKLPEGRAAADFEELERESEDGEIQAGDRLLFLMNGKHAVVNDSGRFRVYSRGQDPIHGGRCWISSARKDFEDLYSNRRVQVGRDGEILPVAKWWLAHRDRRQYQGVVFDPEREHPGQLNLWEGWAIEPKKGSWYLLEELIRVTLCNGCNTMAEYILNWAAHMVQHPSSPAETAIVLQGRKGMGKGTLGQAFMNLVGRHGRQVTHRKHLVGQFNRHLRECLFLFLDEAFWAGDHAGEGVLKGLITEPWAFYEAKGVDGVMGPNRVHILMAANASWVVPAGMDGERRYAVAEVSEEKPSREFFDECHLQLKDGGLAGMLYDLQRKNIDGWHPRNDVPITKALVLQKLHSLDEVGEWWYELLLDGALPGSGGAKWESGPITVYLEDLRARLISKCRLLNASKRSLEVKLANALRRWAPGSKAIRKKIEDGELLETDGRGRARAYKLPPLEDCRKVFSRELGMDIEW